MYVTGHCAAGNHQGTMNLSPGGSLMQACAGAYGGGYWGATAGICNCDCHKLFADMQAFIQEHSDPATDIVSLTPPPLIITSPNIQPAQATVTVEHAPGAVATTARCVPPNHPDDEPKKLSSGRRGRGSLDWEVKKACDYWVTTYPGMPLRPAICAQLIDKDQPPSSGAVDAVWRRWVKLGFATTQGGPVAFTGYTPVGLEKGLHQMKYELTKIKKGKRW